MNIRYIFIFLIFAICGCFESKEPLCSVSDSFLDSRILGKWEKINAQGTLNITNTNGNMLKVMVSKHGLGSPEDIDNHEFKAFICKSESFHYVNLITLSSMKEIPVKWPNKGNKAYILYKYHLNDKGELEVYSPTYKSLKRAIKKNEMKGQASKTTWGASVFYEDSSERMIAWFNKQEEKAFEEPIVYKKIT